MTHHLKILCGRAAVFTEDHLAWFSLTLGGVAVVLGLAIGFHSYRISLEQRELRIRETYLSRARLLAQALDQELPPGPIDRERAIRQVRTLWEASKEDLLDEYLCITDRAGIQ